MASVSSRIPGFAALIMAACLMLGWPAVAQEGAQDGAMYPMEAPDEPGAIALGTGSVADQAAAESWFRQWGDPMVRNVSAATLTPFLPDPEKANGAAVIVAPGGGFRWLSMGNEGWEVARALNARGIAAFVLKYRLEPTAATLEAFEGQMAATFASAESLASDGPPAEAPGRDMSDARADADAAYRMIVARAAEWRVDPARIGMMGFSAGAALTMESALRSEVMDLVFIAPIYGFMSAVEVPADAPALFAAIATDDFLFRGDMGLVTAWHEAEVPVEFHLYQNGGHGFGLGNPGQTSNRWFEAFAYWLEVNGFLGAAQQ